MEFQNLIESFSNDNNPRKSYVYLETILLSLLNKEAEEQNKVFLTNYRLKTTKNVTYEFDAYAPDGIYNFTGPTIFEIKYYTKKESFYYLTKDTRILDKFFYGDNLFQNIIFIFPISIMENDKLLFLSRFPKTNKNIIFWDLNDINNLISKHKDYYNQISNNVFELALNTNIINTLKSHKQDWKDIRNTYISELNESFREDDLVLLLGAGVSKDAGIPSWDKLVSELLVSLIESKLKENKIILGEKERDLIVAALKNENANSPLLQTRYIRTGLKSEFYKVLNNVLYKECSDTSEILKSIAKLCQPLRNRTGIKAIITYNFDNLIEHNLDNIEVSNKPIYRETDVSTNDSLSIYHVHGYLPRKIDDYSELDDSLLVFSEEGYHKVMLDPYHWSNLVQLNYLRENTCLLIGLSVTDPNLRRLLDIAMRKRAHEDCKHYVILKREDITLQTKKPNSKENISISKYNSVNYSLQEEVLKELGLKVIWVEDHKEIPGILKKIKMGSV